MKVVPNWLIKIAGWTHIAIKLMWLCRVIHYQSNEHKTKSVAHIEAEICLLVPYVKWDSEKEVCVFPSSSLFPNLHNHPMWLCKKTAMHVYLKIICCFVMFSSRMCTVLWLVVSCFFWCHNGRRFWHQDGTVWVKVWRKQLMSYVMFTLKMNYCQAHTIYWGIKCTEKRDEVLPCTNWVNDCQSNHKLMWIWLVWWLGKTSIWLFEFLCT